MQWAGDGGESNLIRGGGRSRGSSFIRAHGNGGRGMGSGEQSALIDEGDGYIFGRNRSFARSRGGGGDYDLGGKQYPHGETLGKSSFDLMRSVQKRISAVQKPNLIEIDEKSALLIQWQNSIGKLRETGMYSDCTLMVGGEELKAHRSILSAISPIFEKMFSKEAYQEARDGIVRIEDRPDMLKYSTAKPYQALLSYAYTGSVDWSIYGDCKRDVLVVACKYLILDLKHHVERELAKEITTESLAELALLADTYSCDQLKKACAKFLSSYCRGVVLSPQWGDLTKTRGDLASDLLRLVREDETTATDGGGTK